MVKPLTFKGDKKSKKRKRATNAEPGQGAASDLPSNKLTAQEESASIDDDSWTSAEAAADISGPVIFVLPSEPPACIACDANGKVFVHQLENLIDNNPATSEPHDVRQVWVANRVAGTEQLSFKGHHGRYLSCDKFGLLSATPEAVSPEESFLAIPVASNPGTFAIQTIREKFFAVDLDKKVPEVRGDADDISFSSTLRVRMQARFKPRLKASKEEKALMKITKKELEEAVGRRLEDEEVKKLKRARRDGDYHEVLLDVRVKGKHDKYS
ncbi:MAG: hypothetical protein M1829_006387 [Trizodia sp. TS-e1964]|nr:MAG: hypothetical protein M1829_006387 [Trizodia sp. TS-e1964]